MAYSLAPYVQVLQLDGKIFCGFGSVGLCFELEHEKIAFFEILQRLQSPSSFEFFRKESVDNEVITTIISSLEERRLIVRTELIPVKPNNRHHREQLYFLLSGASPQKVSAELGSKKVTIVGCGGIGCLTALTLLTAGVTHITLIDDDVVELHNISRQFSYSEKDLGLKKVEVLRNQLLDRYSGADIRSLDQKAIFSGNDSNVEEADLVVLAADEPGILPKANGYFVSKKIPFIHISYINDIAAWGPLVIPGVTGCCSCQAHIGTATYPSNPPWESLMTAINASYTCPIISCVSSLAVALATLDIIRFLGGVSTASSINKRIGLWTHDLHFESQDFSRSPKCSVCGGL